MCGWWGKAGHFQSTARISMESIEDLDFRARCERRALNLARQLMLGRSSITSIAAFRQLAETCGEGDF